MTATPVNPAPSTAERDPDNPVLHVIKRDGRSASFDRDRIARAIEMAFRATYDLPSPAPLGEQLITQIARITDAVVSDAAFEARRAEAFHVEQVQDWAEAQLMQAGEFKVARDYIVYREQRSRARAVRGQEAKPGRSVKVAQPDGSTAPLDVHALKRRIFEACLGLDDVRPDDLLNDALVSLYDGITQTELDKALVMVARQRIEREPAYSQVAVRLLLGVLYPEALGPAMPAPDFGAPAPLFEAAVEQRSQAQDAFDQAYRQGLETALKDGIAADLLDPELLTFDLGKIARALEPARDRDFQYLGLQTVYDRYLMHIGPRRIETPQYFFMRVAMGLSLNEDDREARAIEFYGLLSTFRFVSATPTLFNSGTLRPQLSSCYLSTVQDDLDHIFKVIGDNAALSKWAGGLGNDWTAIRATGAHIKGTNGASQGVIPFLKIVNDTALAVNQGGKRKGAVCSYLETWHLDIEEFLELRKNTGDDRRRTHDMHTANWIPDLFMKRVRSNQPWTLFSPSETPDLHDLYGQAFQERYEQYEAAAGRGELKQHRRIDARALWRKMLSMLFETGHPWVTFKDPSNLRSPQDHAGVVHNSNLCTEILLNTSGDETAVCNLGSINLARHTTPDGLDHDRLAQTIRTAVRMLDNVIDINYYPTEEARNANLRHRPVGLGIMGFQDALFIQRLAYDSDRAVEFSDRSMEFISYHAILASTGLAEQRGAYSSYAGSKWSRGLLPLDTLDVLEQERGEAIDVDRTTALDWAPVRQAVKQHGMRNSNVMAIAPTATISNIAGAYQSIEPTYRNLFVKSNLSGDFTIVNTYLVEDLKKRDLWDDQMIDDLKYFDGSVQQIDRIPDDLKALYQTAFEVDPVALVECNARRQKWIDMGISFNQYMAVPSGKMLNDMYFACWSKGLKTTYYLRSQAATQVEKSTGNANQRGFQPRWMKSKSASSDVSSAPGAQAKATPSERATATSTRAVTTPERAATTSTRAATVRERGLTPNASAQTDAGSGAASGAATGGVAGAIGPAAPITRAAASGWTPAASISTKPQGVGQDAQDRPDVTARTSGATSGGEAPDLTNVAAAGNACSIDNPDCEACQ
ncbi:MAG: ribonucleoside-diphosphate reductase subunit alpha [Planctomycetota bacterium]